MEVRAGYKLTDVGVIPDDWAVLRLSDLAHIRSGIAKNSKIAVSDPVRVHYLRVANVQDGFLDLSEMSTLEVSRADLQRYSVEIGDVLMNEGGDLDQLGRGSIWRGAFRPCVHQNHVFVVRCGRRLSPEYLNTWTGGTAARRYFLVAGKQTTNLASINKTALGELPVAVPPASEQRAIASALGDVDALIEGLDRLIAKKRHLKQGAMQQLLTGQARLPGFSGEWEVRQLGDFTRMSMGRTPPRRLASMWGQGHPWLSIADLVGKVVFSSHEQITGAAAASMAVVPRGSLLMSFKLSIGRLAFAGCDLYTNEAICCFEEVDADTEYLYYALQRVEFSRYGKQAVKGYTLNAESLKLVEVPLPRRAEQTAIAAVLSDKDAEIAALEARREKTKALKQGMMQELLTGRTRLVTPAGEEVPA